MSKPKRQLSENDINAIWDMIPREKWTQSKLELIWDQFIPDDCSIQNFTYFLYTCETRGLDPLLSEAYLRLQWDNEKQAWKPVIMVAIGGALKRAHASKEFDGIKVGFEENDNSGSLVSATCQVWRKGCKEPFEAKLYYSEYVQLNKDKKPVFMWATKPHVMLGKSSQMAALRLAFADELGGMFIAEEFGGERTPDTTDFVVRSRSSEEPTSDVRREKEPVEEPPTTGTTIGETTKPLPTTTSSPQEPSLRDQLIAAKQRIQADLSIPKTKSKAIFDAYFSGYLGVDVSKLPKQPEAYSDAIATLEVLAKLYPHTAIDLIEYSPADFGVKAKKAHATWMEVEGWDQETGLVALRLAHAFQFDEFSELKDYLAANHVELHQQADVRAFLKFALIDRDLAMEVAAKAEKEQVPIEFVVAHIESQLGVGFYEAGVKPLREALKTYAITEG